VKKKVNSVAHWFDIVCTPSVNVNRLGVTVPLKFGARGPANVTIPDTKSLVV